MMRVVPDNFTRKVFVAVAFAAIMAAFAPSAPFAAEGTGAAGASFLLLPVGARSIALGEASAALAHDPFAWLSNPGLMPFVEGTGVGAFHSQWALDTYYDNAIIKRELTSLVSIGGAITYLTSPDIAGFDEEGAPTASVSNNNLQGVFSVGIAPIEGLGLGVNAKYLQERIADWTARGWAVDIGAAWQNGFHELTLGVAVQNLGSDITFITEKEKLPTTLRAGVSGAVPLVFAPVTIRLAADFVKPRFEDPYACYGGELDLQSMVFLRAGYTGDTSREGDRFSVGGGLALFGHLMLDYAWSPYGNLGSFHRISLFVR
jgi:hypothetical protein